MADAKDGGDKTSRRVALVVGAIGILLLVAGKSWKRPPAVSPSPSGTAQAAQGKQEVPEMTIKQLGYFDYDPETGGTIPDDVRRLDGRTIRLHGYMISTDNADWRTIKNFALVPTLGSCCYGQPPEMRHIVTVSTRPGQTVECSPDPVIIEGVLSVKEIHEAGFVTSIFQMVCDRVLDDP